MNGNGQKWVEPDSNRPGFDPLYGVHVKMVLECKMISLQQGADFTLICPVCIYVTVYENLIVITSICADISDICGLFAEG